MIADQLPFDIDDNYPDLIRPITQDTPLLTPMTHCPRCTGRLHMDGSIGCCITCGYEDYGADFRPDVAGLTVGSSLPEPKAVKPIPRYRARGEGYRLLNGRKT